MMQLPRLLAGSAWLVGAGPGDAGLLTVHAVNALQQADVVLHDALVAEEILAFVRRGARIETTGKRGYRASMAQEEITRRIIEFASQGLRVVRLKGGDPFVFGRGGEEAQALVDAGVPVSIVPGITSGIAALTAAAIPLTSRGTNSAVVFATGQSMDGEGSIDWRGLALLGYPIVLYMAVRQIGQIVTSLLDNGLSPDTAVCCISNATTAEQRALDTHLGKLMDDLSVASIATPAIIAIGANVALREKLAAGVVSLASIRIAGPATLTQPWFLEEHPELEASRSQQRVLGV